MQNEEKNTRKDLYDSFSNNLISQTIYHLLNFEKYPNFIAAVYGAAVANNFQFVLYNEEYNTIVCVETRHELTSEECIRNFINSEDKSDGVIIPLGDKKSSYWRTISMDNEKYYLALLDNDGAFSLDDLSKISEIIELAMRMWNYKPQRDASGEFVRAVRRGNRGLAASILEELRLEESQFYGIFFLPGFNRADAFDKVVNFEAKYGIKDLKLCEQDGLTGIIYDIPENAQFEDGEWEGLLNDICDSGNSKAFYIMGIEGVEGLCQAFRTINETESHIQYIFPHMTSFSKYEITLAANCVSICQDNMNVKRNYLELIKPLVNAKDTKTKQLMETLETFVLDAGLSTTTTSKLMQIHANTVQYRLKKIRELLATDITSPTRIPGLMMALAIARIDREIHKV